MKIQQVRGGFSSHNTPRSFRSKTWTPVPGVENPKAERKTWTPQTAGGGLKYAPTVIGRLQPSESLGKVPDQKSCQNRPGTRFFGPSI